jgi:hypothetical protein
MMRAVIVVAALASYAALTTGVLWFWPAAGPAIVVFGGLAAIAVVCTIAARGHRHSGGGR